MNGTLVLDRGDVNLTFKRYLEAPITLTLENDYITCIKGEGSDAEMMRSYLAAWGEREAYAVSHVGFGINPNARYEALAMYDRRDTNGTEIRAVAGNFLFSTGANEFAGRYTAGHFDIPVMKTTITIDDTLIVRYGVLPGRVWVNLVPFETLRGLVLRTRDAYPSSASGRLALSAKNAAVCQARCAARPRRN